MIKKLAFSFVFSLLLIGLSVAAYFFLYFPSHPLSRHHSNIVFNLAAGASAKTMVKQLEEIGIHPFQAWLLRWWIQFKKAQTTLRAGEYAFALNITPEALLDKIIKGDVIQHVLTLTEGITIEEALQIITTDPAIKKTLKGESLDQLMNLLGESQGSAEGLFFPDTYYFVLNTSELTLLRLARETMKNKLHRAWINRDEHIALKTPYEALILASIIEKEAAIDSERLLISGVFHRRLQKNMRLQADPTVAYGLKNLIGTLTREHLRQDTPYNTYIHQGLPPTPIALPGIKSIEAALHPEKGDALYFVAKGDGTHHFSATLPEHNEAVLKYQRGGA